MWIMAPKAPNRQTLSWFQTYSYFKLQNFDEKERKTKKKT